MDQGEKVFAICDFHATILEEYPSRVNTMDITDIVAVLTAVVTVASIIASLTPTPKDDKIVGKCYKVIDALALNIGKAKNKPGE